MELSMGSRVPDRTAPAGSAVDRRSVLGSSLAARAVAVATERDGWPQSHPGLLDLTQPESVLAPEHVRQAARDALARGETHYTVRPGVPELRSAIAERLTADGFPATVDNVVITNGGAEAVYIVLQANVQAGSHVLVVDPVAPNVLAMLRFIGARITRFATCPTEFPDDATVLLAADPSPISGVAAQSATIERMIRAAIERGIRVTLDRTVADCRYDGTRSMLDDPSLGEQVATTGSFSMSHGLAGWRVGWLSAPAAQMATLRELKQSMSICTTAVSQFAALAALDGPTEWLGMRRSQFLRRRELVIDRLRAANLDVVVPDAWPGLLIATSSIDPNDDAVARRLREDDDVRVDAGSTFGQVSADRLRIDLGVPEQTLITGIERIVALRERSRS